MSVPVWVLLAFAAWTVLTLMGTVGVYRWRRILAGRASPADFPADRAHGAAWYRRAMRAHANCVENLPLYAAVVVAGLAAGVRDGAFDALALLLLAARVAQTLVHVGASGTAFTVSVRFAFYFVQIVCMTAMGVIVALAA